MHRRKRMWAWDRKCVDGGLDAKMAHKVERIDGETILAACGHEFDGSDEPVSVRDQPPRQHRCSWCYGQ